MLARLLAPGFDWYNLLTLEGYFVTAARLGARPFALARPVPVRLSGASIRRECVTGERSILLKRQADKSPECESTIASHSVSSRRIGL